VKFDAALPQQCIRHSLGHKRSSLLKLRGGRADTAEAPAHSLALIGPGNLPRCGLALAHVVVDTGCGAALAVVLNGGDEKRRADAPNVYS
jgi:hypothetical protein